VALVYETNGDVDVKGLSSVRSANGKEVEMLVLSRKVSQQIMIGSNISITIVKIDRNHARIGIEAPDGVTILRGELMSNWRASRDLAESRSKRMHAKAV
jgi:carbon storage regulator CsrA